jgi:hypothetical protein
MINFLKDFKIYPMACGTTEGVLAGAISSTGNPIDMANVDGAVFIAHVEKVVTTTSGINLYLVASCSSNGTYGDIAGSAIQCGSSDTNFYCAVEYKNVSTNPLDKRWVAAKCAVPATCSWVGSILGITYGGRSYPVTQPTCCYTDMVISATSGTI